jgi:hypothetical protein
MEQASEPEAEDARLIMVRVVLLTLATVGSVVLSVSALLAVGWLSVAVIVIPIVGPCVGSRLVHRVGHPAFQASIVALARGLHQDRRSRQGPGGLDASRDISRS